MHKLDNKKIVDRLDPADALGSVDLLGAQVEQVWREFKKVKLPKSYKKVDKILINAMGGSALPGHIMKSVYFEELKKPLQIINSYKIPAHLDKNTLYIICSYSGTTEEPVSTFNAAQKTGAKIFIITSGGKLAKLIKQGKAPGYIFDPVANPSKQPRIGVGYTVAAHLALLKRLGFIKVSDTDVKDILSKISSFKKKFGFDVAFVKNKAKQLAQEISGKAILIAASEHLAGNAHVFANQTNETGKTLSAYHLVSEFNHHLLEGLQFPASNRSDLLFIFLESDLYHPKNQFRYKISKRIVVKNKVATYSYKLTSTDRLTQSFEALVFSSYVTFYLAMINNLNPNLIPWVDLFKEELKKF